jgi:hypothetical protein
MDLPYMIFKGALAVIMALVILVASVNVRLGLEAVGDQNVRAIKLQYAIFQAQKQAAVRQLEQSNEQMREEALRS